MWNSDISVEQSVYCHVWQVSPLSSNPLPGPLTPVHTDLWFNPVANVPGPTSSVSVFNIYQQTSTSRHLCWAVNSIINCGLVAGFFSIVQCTFSFLHISFIHWCNQISVSQQCTHQCWTVSILLLHISTCGLTVGSWFLQHFLLGGLPCTMLQPNWNSCNRLFSAANLLPESVCQIF